jgi:signal transduction histidine kinase
MIRSMNDSVAILGHEMRNLIATFAGFTELLLSQEWPRAQQKEYLETMHEEALRVAQFMQDIVDLQRIEAGALTLKPRPTELGPLLTYAATIAAHDPKHPIVLDCPNELPPALAEPDRIQQVLANLLSNARKYTPTGGPIHLAARVVKNFLEVSVLDSGVGIPTESMPRLFEKFFRVDSPGHRSIRGTGIGLALCRRIVEAHGGRIWVESAGPGRGARFVFTLPLALVSRRSGSTLGALPLQAVPVGGDGRARVGNMSGAGAVPSYPPDARPVVRGACSVSKGRLRV